MTDVELPKQVLLTKLLKMTSSSNDGEALTAMRKANALLTAAGWDWDRLIAGKIRVIEDPFKNLGVPTTTTPASRPSAPPRPTPPRPMASTTWPLGIQPNRYAGFCYCCGGEVLSGAGFIFKPVTHNSNASSDWKIACPSCNGTNSMPGSRVTSMPASRQRGTKKKPFVSDLS